MSNRQAEITALLVPIIASLQLELLGVEFVPSGAHALLRLYIDVLPEAQRQVSIAQRQVTIEDCEAVSREVSATLDVNDPISSAYTLEVSSPGIDRPLFTPAQFARHLGESAKITLSVPIDGRRRMQGRIERVDGQAIVLIVDGKESSIAHENIEKARLLPDYVALGIAPRPKPSAKDAAMQAAASKAPVSKDAAPKIPITNPTAAGKRRRAGNKSKRNAADVAPADSMPVKIRPVTEHES